MVFKILIFEDSSSKLDSFVEYLTLRLTHELNSSLKVVQRLDNSMLESDLMTNTFDIILIDDDLGNDNWGNDIIDEIVVITDSTPETTNVSKIYYSAGTSITDLKYKIAHHGNIQCVSFQNLVDIVFEKLNTIYQKHN